MPVTGAPRGRPKKRWNGTTITLSISEADKRKVKAYAANSGLSVSDLLHVWITEHCDFNKTKGAESK